MIFNKKSIYNRLPGVGVMSNKKTSAQIFKRMSKFYDTEFDFIPQTFLLPQEGAQLKQAMKKSKGTWIVKPKDGAEGCGIFLV